MGAGKNLLLSCYHSSGALAEHMPTACNLPQRLVGTLPSLRNCSRYGALLMRQSACYQLHAARGFVRQANGGKIWTTHRLRDCVKACTAGTSADPAASPSDGSPSSSPELTPASSISYVDAASSSREAPVVDYVFTDPVALQLQRRAIISWPNAPPSSVLIVKKSGNKPAAQALQDIAEWCTSLGMRVLVERPVAATEFPQYEMYDQKSSDTVDVCVTLGGDGTVLHCASLFDEDEPLPPVVSFAMGTLGFLTPFNVQDFKDVLGRVLHANDTPVHCTLRGRKRCEVWSDGQLMAVHNVLNECLIDRGASASMMLLELFIDGYHVTTVQADGLILATASGSTAYSMSAGGPMVAPSVPCGIITPVAPHSLSFRPIIVPESSDVEVHVPTQQRSHPRVSFDGRHTRRLLKGSVVRCRPSHCPLPMVNLMPLDGDWYEGLSQKLKWNVSIREPPSRVIGRSLSTAVAGPYRSPQWQRNGGGKAAAKKQQQL